MRRIGTLAVMVGVLVAGCSAPTAPADGPTSRPFPDPPESLTAETAGEYVAAFEETYRYNVIVAAEDNLTSVSVGCNAVETTPIENGYRVTVNCGFTWMFESDGSAGVADGRPYNATYRVGGGLIERVNSTL